MRPTYITATAIALLLVAWLYSGEATREDAVEQRSLAALNREQARVDEDAAPTRVRVAVLDAVDRPRVVRVRGKTENKRTVEVKTELNGRIVARPVDRGSRVAAGDLLCRISTEDREVALAEEQAALSQARIDYQGALRLKQKGFNSESAIAAARARLVAAEAAVRRRELDLQRLTVRAPFGGIVEDVHLEIGAFVTPGATCATLVDLDPMLLTGRVSEREVVELDLGQIAEGRLRDGRTVRGPVTFVGQQADAATRTYAIEIELPNPDYALRSGITTEILIPVESVLAHKISPAVFTLDDAGGIGVRTVNADNVVEFHGIEVLDDAADGVWVTGLPPRAAVITVGQELVTAGERVDPVYLGSDTLPAQSPGATEPEAATPPSGPSASTVVSAAVAAQI